MRQTDRNYEMYAKADMILVHHGHKQKFEKIFFIQRRLTPVMAIENKGKDGKKMEKRWKMDIHVPYNMDHIIWSIFPDLISSL